ncbi:TRAM domain-containing protein [Cardiobacteriaceae bacterium TAE3-ERU3]|nr:TRAM domain-containing protein [Cardiobacteriaceae bacterium TAE3-ERU3]
MNSEAVIESLDYQGRGVARLDGKAVFVSGALPGERVRIHITRDKKRFAEAQTKAVLSAAPMRVEPSCVYYNSCGGCDLQHSDADWQIEAKQQLWLEQLERLGGVRPEVILPALSGDPWHYRSRARLSVAYVGGAVLLGFKGRQSHRVVDVDSCLVLDARISEAFPALRTLLAALLPLKVEEVSLNVGDSAVVVGLKSQQWHKKATQAVLGWQEQQAQEWQVWRHGHGYVEPVQEPALTFSPTVHTQLPFTPDDFTQVNAAMNQAMVAQALSLLSIEHGQRILDLFCGLGNFAVPMAKVGANVLAIEGVQAMVNRLRETAKTQNLADQLTAERADLFAVTAKDIQRWGKADAWLLDPPRAGAQAVVEALAKKSMPQKIVYVSCNPSTLARDAKVLVGKGYRAAQGGIINMFPQTAHVESMVMFLRD